MKTLLLIIGLITPQLIFAGTSPKASDNFAEAGEEPNRLCGAMTQIYNYKLTALARDIKTTSLTDVQVDDRIQELVDFRAQLNQVCADN